ncbi:NAD(P)-binding protein, partial [Fibrobacterota bacterium]
INQLKKFVMDHEMKAGTRIDLFKAKGTGKKVAVIGGGAQGLSAAFFLARLGHEPEILEAQPRLGGILRYVISKDRLPDEVLDWEIQGILDLGVKASTDILVGKNYTIKQLFEKGNEAVLITSGGMDSRKIIRGAGAREQALPGLHLLVDFLSAVSMKANPKIGKQVCIIESDGNAAKVAGLCKDLGAEQVNVITRSQNPNVEDNAYGTTYASSIPVSMSGNEDMIDSLTVESLTSGEQSVIPADTVIIAGGRLPELVLTPVREAGSLKGWQTLETFRGISEKRKEGLFSTVEPGRVSDYTAVVKAAGTGRKIAGLLHRYLMGEELVPQKSPTSEAGARHNVHTIDDLEPIPRNLPEGLPESAIPDSGIPVTDIGFNQDTAVKEASRCLDCGLICYTRAKNNS